MKRENGFCVFPTSDSQPLEYCSAIVRLLPLGGANKEREGWKLTQCFQESRVLAEAAAVGQSQECWGPLTKA